MTDQITIFSLMTIVVIIAVITMMLHSINKRLVRERALLIQEHNRICITMASLADAKPRKEVEELLSNFDLESIEDVRTVLMFTVIASQEYLHEKGI